MSQDCLFCKITKGEIPSEKVYEDEDVFAFRDINPVAPTHILVVPKAHYSTLNDLPVEKLDLVSKIFGAVKKIAEQENIAESGYRTIINTNKESGQVVFHIHFHILGGRQMRGLG